METMSSNLGTIDFRIYSGGYFEKKRGKTEYVGGALHLLCGVWINRLSLKFLKELGDGLLKGKKTDIWYRRRGLSLTAGRTKVSSEHDIGEFLKTKDFMNIVSLYVTEQEIPVRTQVSPRTKRPSVGPAGGDPSSDSSPCEKKPNLRASPNLNADPNVDAHPNVNTHPDVTAQSKTWDSFIVRPFTSTYQSCLESSPTLNAPTKKKLLVIRSHVRRSPRQHKDSSSSISPLLHASSLAPIHVVPLASLPPLISQPSKVAKLPETLASRRSLNFVEPEQVKEKQPVSEGSDVVRGKEKLQVRSEQLGVKSEGKQVKQQQGTRKALATETGKEKAAECEQLGVKPEGKQVKQQQGNRKALATEKGKKKAAECESEKSKGKGKESAAEKSKGKGKKPASEKTKGKEKETASEKRKRTGKETASEERKRKGKEISASNTRKRKASLHESESESEVHYEDSDDDDELTDTELQYDDFEKGVGEEEDLFTDKLEAGDLLSKVHQSLGVETGVETGGRGSTSNVGGLDVNNVEDEDLDEDDLVSLHGSDDDVDPYPCFNANTDFTKPIVLKVGLKFSSNKVLRKTIIHHAIEKGYDYYYLHNTKSRLTAFCKNRCACEWNVKTSKLGSCTCKAKNKCKFKVHARKLKLAETFQIKSLELNHNCRMATYNTKVGSEFLAEKYLDFWRINIDWKIKNFQEHVFSDLGVKVSYYKCWLAKQRAKLIIYGNGKDQYSRVWDYAAAIRKFNRGSTAFVVCDSVDRPPPIFKRMYICLKACKDGFLSGCRPIIGVDGCHLKGAFPGICLVAVGVDGNNNIFPLAWAVVEVENTHSWTWFLELLIGDLEKQEGNGLTFISDRQKGLLDAFKSVAPKAYVRFCARHIWANFKLSFSGEVYKETFWRAAKATTKAEFDSQMEGMKFLSNQAWSYLHAIDPKHWSRHAFDSKCKSNMSLNNVCESFNAVLKEARDKPILTHMEWMRRYVMQRNCEKRELAAKYEGKLMPHVKKWISWATDESKACTLIPSTVDVFEVLCRGDTWVVNLKEKTCGCYYWDLSGLPCPHAMACIQNQRLDPEDYVDESYSRERYLLAYTPAVSPMPGMKQWEKSSLPEPLPPPLKKLPGRPSAKKRKKEVGEGKESSYVLRTRKPNKCGKCGQLGHYKRTCKNEVAPPQENTTKGGRPTESGAWTKQQREKTLRRKATKDACRSQTSTSNAQPTVPTSTQQSNV